MVKPCQQSKSQPKTTKSTNNLLSPKLFIYLISISALLFILFHIQSLHHHHVPPQPSSAADTAAKLRRSVTFLPLKDLRYSNKALVGHTWFMSSLYDIHEDGEVQFQQFPSPVVDGDDRILCLKGRDTHDGSWNYYGLAWPEALPENATVMKGVSFVSYNHYDYGNIWHGLSALMPFVAWHQIQGKCEVPERWILYHWGELRLKMGNWITTLMEATFGAPLHIEAFEGIGDGQPVCFEKAVVMRHNEGGMSRQRRMETYDFMRCKARLFCNFTMPEPASAAVRMTILMRTGARSFRNEKAVVEIFGEECAKVAGCRLTATYSNNLTFCEQVSLMRKTDILISPHGAQLTNMILMNRNSSVMEFFPKGWLELAGIGQYVHHWLASWSGMRHQGAWRDPDGPPCPYSPDDRRCMSVYKGGTIGYNRTHFSEWAKKVLNEVKTRKMEEATQGEDGKVESREVRESKGKKKQKNNKEQVETVEEETGCWIALRIFGSCISSRSKVDSSISGTSINYAESKSTADSSRDQPTPRDISSTNTSMSNAESNSSTSKLEEELKISPHLRKFSFNDLKLATRNFRPESLLGEGGFGCVFKGWVEENGTAPVKPGTGLTVAVKTLNHDGLQGHKEWMAEVNFLSDLKHPNLVRLIGYCNEDDQRLLVYEFMPRGSLENHLFRRSLPLPWSIRMKIALGAAKGLAFLHEEAKRPVIYRDFKTSNILLDAEYNAKLSDFGLAKDGPDGDKTHVSTRVMGTYGYAAPEYVMTGHLTSRSDVYSFGVVLLEMLTGRRSMDKNRPNGEHNLVEWARPYLGEKKRFYRLIDPRLEGHFSIKGAQKAVQLAAQCLSRDQKVRPLMSEVVEALKPLPNLKDMASSSYYFQTMQADRIRSSPMARNGYHTAAGPVPKNGQQLRSYSVANGSHASPYHHQQPHPSPKPNVKA